MNFNTPEFFCFLLTLLFAFKLVYNNDRARNALLLFASYFFYMSWNWRYAGLIAFSTVLDYFIGLRLEKEERTSFRKFYLILSLTTNLGLLAVFKYYNFFITTVSDLGLVDSLSTHAWLLPVGISFYTFQTLSYSIDVFRREISAEKSFIKFALFVSFFPQLVAGPIVRASTFLPQLKTKPRQTKRQFSIGLQLIFKGLFKKIIIADLLASLAVDRIFANPSAFSSWDLLMGLYGYTFQIYNDFSGYSDIAIGVALLFGYHLPENFNRPYLSQNLREFWTRWHISLSTWLKDYLYIPLGGNRCSKLRVSFNLMVTMLLGGLWHGAATNFVLWGAYHGVLLGVSRNRNRKPELSISPSAILNAFVCFHLVVFGWLLFRVSSIDLFVEYLEGIVRFTIESQLHLYFYLVLVLGAFAHLLPKKRLEKADTFFISLPAPVRGLTYAVVILLLCAFSSGTPSFIYFQF